MFISQNVRDQFAVCKVHLHSGVRVLGSTHLSGGCSGFDGGYGCTQGP
jgi:hypothetical protein